MAHQLINDKINAAVVIGGVNMDIWGRPAVELVAKDSAPGFVCMTPGGVGRNIAHNLCLLGMDVGLVAALGDDSNGASLKKHCLDLGMDMSLSPVILGRNSSCYLYITDGDGDMALAINEMDICREISPEYLASILPELEKYSALVLDANLSEESIAFICENLDKPIYADPVSTVKGGKFLPHLNKLRAFKPNSLEAQSLTGMSDPESAAAELVRMGVKHAYVSDGGNGMVVAEGDNVFRVPCLPTVLVNATGGGDAAMAALCDSFCRDLDSRSAALRAVAAGSIAVESAETISPLMSGSAIDAKLG